MQWMQLMVTHRFIASLEDFRYVSLEICYNKENISSWNAPNDVRARVLRQFFLIRYQMSDFQTLSLAKSHQQHQEKTTLILI